MAKIILVDPLGFGSRILKHRHFTRDWTGAFMPGCLPFPPLDLMYAAAYLRKHGCRVQIIEASIRHLKHDKVAKIIEAGNPDFVFIPSTYFTLEDDKKLSGLIKNRLPHTKIIIGGPLVTYDPSLALSCGDIDYVALGEPELPVLSIVRGELGPNIAYLKEGKINTGARNLLDLKGLPIPARDLIDNQAYKYAVFNRGNPITAMTISRGCPHSKCRFCVSPLYTLKEIRYRDIDSITEEINEIKFKYKIGEIFFRDQTFTASRELVYKICEYFISRGINLPWRVSTRVDSVDKELLKIMARAGCYQISYGFESHSQESLDKTGKGIRVEQSELAAKWTKDAGIEIAGLFMYRMEGDTENSIKELFNFALKLKVDYAQFNEIFLLPGSPVYEDYVLDKTILLPSAIVKRNIIAAYLKFYLGPARLRHNLKKIKSFAHFKFVIRAGIDEILSTF